jgi:hypothetical protein
MIFGIIVMEYMISRVELFFHTLSQINNLFGLSFQKHVLHNKINDCNPSFENQKKGKAEAI